MSFRYILRYYIDPGFHEDDRIAELAQLCRTGKIAEVMLFHNPEELYQGYPSEAEDRKWFALAIKVREMLRKEGVRMSINPWTTLVHLSRGRVFGAAQSTFQPLVGETGEISRITACPFDRGWQEYLCGFFARIAAEISPDAIWVEDDWRLHNHEPGMKYGGCFCPLHLARFAREAGVESVDRETLLKAILAPGEPHPWRKIWLKVCRDSLLEPAQKLYQRVHDANPGVRLGLMSSTPDVHSIEGRDWNLLQQALSPDQPLLVRPHLPPYTECFALMRSPVIARQTISEYDGALEIYPELENSPRSGAYSKSAAFSLYECLESAFFGSSGITINHYDMMGNGMALDRDFPAKLGAARPFLDAIADLHLSDRDSEGIRILYSPAVAASFQLNKAASSLQALQAQSAGWGDVCHKTGISGAYTRTIESGKVHAVSGGTLDALSDGEIRELLSGPAALDACSAEILLRRGFGAEIGIAAARWTTLNDTGYGYEDIPAGKAADFGVDAPRMSASRCADELLEMTPAEGAEILSRIHKGDRSILFPGSIRFRNALGGTIFVICYPLNRSQFNMGFYNNFRRIFLQQIFRGLAGDTAILCAEERPLEAYRIPVGGKTMLAILNPLSDTADSVAFAAPDLDLSHAEMLLPDGSWIPADLQQESNGTWRSLRPLPPYQALVLLR